MAQKRTPGNGAYRILMLHHHIVPVTYRENATVDVHGSIVFDANAIIEWIADHGIDLVLHGHQHQPFLTRLSYPLRHEGLSDGSIARWHEFYVVGLGSTGVNIEHLGEIKKNVYGVLDLKSDGIEISIRSISPSRTYKSGTLWSVPIPRRK
jgi:hypothetical protein